MNPQRTRFQGVFTIVRFNWHFYVIAFAASVILICIAGLLPQPFFLLILVVALGITFTALLSLVASYLAYDSADLYELEWLKPLMVDVEKGANIHAGFDETSGLLSACYPEVAWQIYDFYDPEKHREVSIKRARAACPPTDDTIAHSTTSFPSTDRQFDIILLTLSAHEIRDTQERIDYFKTLSGSLKLGGKIIVTEHVRDVPNMLVYNVGSLHFHTFSEWYKTFNGAELSLVKTMKPAPFITTFILAPHETTD